MTRRTSASTESSKAGSKRISFTPLFVLFLAGLFLNLCEIPSAHASATYVSGHISNITLAGEDVLIQLDSGLPDNCAGTTYGWMSISGQNKPMVAFVLGLYLRGDSSTVAVVVFTTAVDGTGYCSVTQIDPEG